MSHKFTVGQAVALAPGVLRYAAAGEYEIRCLVPAPDNDPRDPRYRIKNISREARARRLRKRADLVEANQFCVLLIRSLPEPKGVLQIASWH